MNYTMVAHATYSHLFLILTFLAVSISKFNCLNVQVDRFTIIVDAYGEECFFENVANRSLIQLIVQVKEGGFRDIGVKLKFPNGTGLYDEKVTNQVYFENFTTGGLYEFCLNNEMSTITPKEVQLVVAYLTQDQFDQVVQKHNLAKQNMTMEDLIELLRLKLSIFSAKNSVLLGQKKNHHKTSERTNTWVLWWAVFESLTLISLTISQIYYITKFFEVKRLI